MSDRPVPPAPFPSTVPAPPPEVAPAERLLIQLFARMDPLALGAAVGLFSGLLVCLATLFLVLKGGETIGPTMALLGQFFLGYTVTFGGAIIGLAYGALAGFLLGWLTASLYNFSYRLYLFLIKFKATFNSSIELFE